MEHTLELCFQIPAGKLVQVWSMELEDRGDNEGHFLKAKLYNLKDY